MPKPASAAATILGFCATLFIPRTATPQQPSAAERRTTWSVKNWTRAERWSFFEPPPGGGGPDYGDLGNRLRFGVERTARRYEFLAALQYVQFAGLPTDASGPGPLGVGAVYFDHSGRSDSRQLYVRYLRLRLKDLAPGLSLDIGRMGFADGAETSTGNATIDRLKLMRATGRLVGEFEWSLYERGFDGAQIDWDRGQWHIRAAALRPTQGGFEDAAGRRIDDIGLLTASASLRPNSVLKSTDVQMFFYRYDDGRPVRQRPDNTGRATARADVHISTFGATLVGAYPSSAGSIDTLVWVAGQVGSWYDQPHRGLVLGLEAGHQWRAARWQPWIRAGWLRASGDSDPLDGKHETFFQLLPTGRKLSQSATYSLMNLSDLFLQALLSPARRLELRIDWHRLRLVEDADLWYSGSGATQRSGGIFGFSGRPSHGGRSLGAILEGSATYTTSPHWSINGYVGVMRGGDVVERTFAGDRLMFAYLESVLAF